VFAVTNENLSEIYRGYIACLNGQDWARLGQFVHDDVCHNGRQFGLAGYREMLERNFQDIPDLRFAIEILVADPPHVATRLGFHCTPRGSFLDLPVDGRKVSFTENVIYRFRASKIERVWSIVDKAAIEAQLRSG
jgi:predicted ester cyclase